MSTALFWHRRDLRIHDNAGLFKALEQSSEVIPVFIFDRTILDLLPKNDQRVLFIHQELNKVKQAYRSLGSDMVVLYGDPKVEISNLARKYNANAVYTNRDYEPNAIARDQDLVSQQRPVSPDVHPSAQRHPAKTRETCLLGRWEW